MSGLGHLLARELKFSSSISFLKSPQFIMENYMYLPLNDTISSKKIEEFNSNLIDALKKKHSRGVSSSNYKIVPYGQFKGEKKLFSGLSQDIVILTVQNKPAIYFYFYENKIFSFTLMKKASTVTSLCLVYQVDNFYDHRR
jgi:hypothetical protein